MSKDYASRKSFSSEVHPKSSGDIATNEDQIVLPFNWKNNSDKTLVKVYTKDGYQLDLMRGMSELTELDRADTLYIYDDSADSYYSVSVGVIEDLLSAHEDVQMANFQHSGSGNQTSPVGTNTWGTTPLNTEQYNSIDGCSIDTGTGHITLPAGKYEIDWKQLFFRVRYADSRIYDVTNSTVLAVGDQPFPDDGSDGSSTNSHGKAVIELADTTVIRMEHKYNFSSSYEIGFFSYNTTQIYSYLFIKSVDSIRGPQGDPPEHEWNGPYLRFKNPDGTWGDWQNLQVDGEGGQISLPIGYVYMQLPGEDDPSTLNLAGTWDNISSSYAGDFFRVEGGDASDFGSGRQLDQMQRLTGSQRIYRARFSTSEGVFSGTFNYGGNSGDTSPANDGPQIDFDSANSPDARTSSTTDGETRPVNQTIRVWKRIS